MIALLLVIFEFFSYKTEFFDIIPPPDVIAILSKINVLEIYTK
jgi:hypothetical protein